MPRCVPNGTAEGEIMKIYVDVEGLEVQGKRNRPRMKQTMFRR